MSTFPKLLYVQLQGEDDDKFFMVQKELDGLEDGKVATYQLVEEYEHRTVPQLRRKGTKKWFAPA